MAKGVINSEAFNKQVIETVLQNRRTRGVKTVEDEFTTGTKRLTTSRFREHCVILDAALPAATNAKTGATSCLATICQWSVTDEQYIETDLQILVWNHSESTDHSIDTFGVGKHIDGHYWFFGDCDPMGNRGGA